MINLKELNKKTYLQELAQDEKRLGEIIKETNGYVLQLMDTHQVVPPRSFIAPDLEKIPAYALNFLVKNYSFEKDELKILRAYFKYKTASKVEMYDEESNEIEEEDTHNNSVAIGSPTLAAVGDFVQKQLSPEETVEYLTTGLMLPENTPLSLDILHNYTKEILALYKKDSYSTLRILSASLNTLSVEEFLNLPPELLKKNVDVFDNYAIAHKWDAKTYQSHEAFRSMYLNFLLAEERIGAHDFRRCGFKDTERDLLLKLLPRFSTEYTSDTYEKLSEIPGVKELITKHEYYTFNPRIFAEFSVQEIEADKAFFQAPWLKKIKEGASYYEAFGFFRAIEEDSEKLEAFLTPDFFTKIMEKAKIRHFDTSSEEKTEEAKRKNTILYTRYVDYVLEKMRPIVDSSGNTIVANSFENIEISTWDHTFKRLIENMSPRYNTTQEEIDKNNIIQKNLYDKTFEIYVPIVLKSDMLMDNARHNDFLTMGAIPALKEYSEKNPSLNLLYFLLVARPEITSNFYGNSDYQHSQRGYKEELEKIIFKLASTVERKKAKLLTDRFGFEFKPETKEDKQFKAGLKKQPRIALGDFENNFLAYEGNAEKVKQLDSSAITSLYAIDPNFSKFILEHDIKVENYWLGQLISKDNKKDFQFVLDYVAKHKESLAKDEKFIKMIVDHPRGHEVYQQDVSARDEAAWREYIEKRDYYKSLIPNAPEEKPSNGYRHYENEDEDDEEDEDEEDNNTVKSKKIELTEKEQDRKLTAKQIGYKFSDLNRGVIGAVSFNFLKNKIIKAIQEEDFEILRLANGEELSSLLDESINNMSYKTLMKNLDNPHFISILENKVDYEGKTNIQFSVFNAEENYSLAKKIQTVSEKFKFNNESYKNKVLSFFRPEAVDFVREYAIEEIPLQMFYGYDLEPGAKSPRQEKVLIKTPFTAEEVIRAYENLEKKGDFFSYNDINARYNHFFSTNFKSCPEELMKLLDISKEKYPKLYLIACGHETFEILYEWNNKKQDPNYEEKEKNLPWDERKTRDQIIQEGMRQFLDIDAACLGIKAIVCDILEKTKPSEEDTCPFNKNLANSTISSFLSYSYGDVPKSNNNEQFSLLTREESQQIIRTVCEVAPAHIWDRHMIGCINNPGIELKENFAAYLPLNFNTIEQVLYYNRDVAPGSFNSREKETLNTQVENIVLGLIQAFVNNSKIEEVNYLSYIIELNKFVENHITYEHVFEHKDDYNSLLPLFKKSTEIAQKLEIYNTKFFLNNMLEQQMSSLSNTVENKANPEAPVPAKKRMKI